MGPGAPNSLRMVRVTMKQMNQMNMYQHVPLQSVPHWPPGRRGTQWRAVAPVEAEASMALVPRPEDGHMVSMVVRQVTSTRL